jgi:hypothetical protein
VSVLADRLERHQVAVYLAALAVGVLIGLVVPGADGVFEAMIYPVLRAAVRDVCRCRSPRCRRRSVIGGSCLGRWG